MFSGLANLRDLLAEELLLLDAEQLQVTQPGPDALQVTAAASAWQRVTAPRATSSGRLRLDKLAEPTFLESAPPLDPRP